MDRTFTREQQAAVEQAFRDRAKAQGWKPGTKTYLKQELEFIVGAMTVLNVIYPSADGNLSREVPPMWVMGPLSGRSVTIEKP